MILSDDEIRAIQARHPTDNNPMDFARAIIAATVAKLAAGVSVEPVIRGWMNPMNGVVIDPQRKKQIGVGDGYPNFSVPLYDESGTVTRNQITTAIAAARVQENERLACEFDKLYTYGGDEIGPAIRALIGAKTCTSDEYYSDVKQGKLTNELEGFIAAHELSNPHYLRDEEVIKEFAEKYKVKRIKQALKELR